MQASELDRKTCNVSNGSEPVSERGVDARSRRREALRLSGMPRVLELIEEVESHDSLLVRVFSHDRLERLAHARVARLGLEGEELDSFEQLGVVGPLARLSQPE